MNQVSGAFGDTQTTRDDVVDILEFMADALMSIKQTNERTLHGAGLVLLSCREVLNRQEPTA